MPEITVKSDEIKKCARGQAVVEAHRPIEKDMKILSVTATACIRPGEVFAGEARYLGKVRFDCLAADEEGPKCISAVAEYTDRIADNNITAGATVLLSCEVINVESSVNGGELKLVAVVDADLMCVSHSEKECLTEPEQGIYAEKSKLCYTSAVAQASETLYVSDGISDVKAAEILMPVSRAVLTAADCADGEIKLSGAVYTTLIVRTEDGLLSTYRVVTPFVKSVAAPGVDESCTAIATVCVADSTATFVSEGGDNSVDIAVTLQAEAVAVRRVETEAVVDVFCAENQLDVVSQTLDVCATEPTVTVIDNVDGQMTLAKDSLPADNVLCVTNTFCNISSARIEDGRVTAEGLAGGDIIYYSAEHNKTECVAFRIPFSMPLDIHTECTEVDLTATVTDVTVRVRRESVFDIKVETAFTAKLGSCEQKTVIKSAKRGEAIDRPAATVIVHIARAGETLWQAAKALGCSPERVTEQNPTPAPYVGGERLVNFCARK